MNLPPTSAQPTSTPATSTPATAGNPMVIDTSSFSRFLNLTDRWCEKLGDYCNPILVKETRQALKSRQFAVTFSVLLIASLGWTVIGSLSMMPAIYTTPSAPRMLMGYYVVLAIPMLLVVPLAAYRSLETEIDDGTLELLSITVLSPRQIVQGKLSSAMLQMLLYFVALFPCMAYAYTLRGVDLPTLLLMALLLATAGVLLTIAALFFAPLARTRTGRIVTLLAVITVLVLAQWAIGFIVIGLIQYGNPLSFGETFFAILASFALVVAVSDLLLACTTAQLTPASENRSTRIRLSLLFLTCTCTAVATIAMGHFTGPRNGIFFGSFIALSLLMLVTVASSMMCAESPLVTPRVRRELPDSYLARVCLTWLTPGPLTGLVFSVVLVTVLCGSISVMFEYARANAIGNPTRRQPEVAVTIAFGIYLCLGLCLVYWMMRLLRVRNDPRVETGVAALIAIAAVSCLVPYSIGLHLNDYRDFSYSPFQITNWAWTIYEVGQNGSPMTSVYGLGVVTVFLFLITLLTDPKLVFPRRMAMPKRVQEELKQRDNNVAV